LLRAAGFRDIRCWLADDGAFAVFHAAQGTVA
jgi:hypothetical protein